MAENKENIRANEKSGNRIPVLITKRRRSKDETPQSGHQSRDPLKTLLDPNVEICKAGPSHKITQKIDSSSFVTHRNQDDLDDLDWNFEVFRDNLNKTLCKYGTTDERLTSLVENKPGSSDGVVKSTPSLPMKLSAGVESLKKIKRSLKRPHARGLHDGASPMTGKAYHCTVCSNSNIQGPAVCILEPETEDLGRDYVLDNLNYLLIIEKKVPGAPKIRKASRSCLINWIINVNGSSGMPAVVQTATWYLDYYLNSTWVMVNRLQVVGAACFWLATKMHGRTVASRRLVKYSGEAFVEKELLSAEKSVLRKLHYRALPVVPFDFVPYLASCCDPTGTGVIETAAEFLCQCAILVDNLLAEEYPSVIAAAAVLNALMLLRHYDLLDSLKANAIYKAAERKAGNLNDTCSKLREAVRVVSAVGYEYKAPIFKFSCPPHYISSKINKAVLR